MTIRQASALWLVWLLACSSVPRQPAAGADAYETSLKAARYELRVLTADTGQPAPVEVSQEKFQRAMRVLARDVHPSSEPRETARWLMEGSLETDLLAEVERGRVVRLMPMEDSSPLEVASAAQLKRRYLEWCQQEYGGGDCLGLLEDGPVLKREDVRTLALALSLRDVLRQTGQALGQLMSPQALVALVVWTGAFYLLLWMLPEPVSKLLAAGLTVALLAWLPVHTLWSLMDGWAQLVHEVDRATSYEQVERASEKFRRLMGENTARVLVMVVTAALTGGSARFAARLPELPGFARAAQAQGGVLAEAAEVEAVAATEAESFTLMVRRPGGGGQAAAAQAVEADAGITTIIRHRGGNRQVFRNGERWHVPADKSVQELPTADPMGDQLQAAAQRAASRWSRSALSAEEADAIRRVGARGQYLQAHLLERMYRGKWVEEQLRREFTQLRWSPNKGVDAVDPATGRQYEVLSGTTWNFEQHGRRMSEEFFRMIPF